MHVRVRIIVFFNDTATTEIYTYLHTLSLHDALPIYGKLSDCLNLFHWSTASASGSAGMLAGADCGITLLSWVAYQRICSGVSWEESAAPDRAAASKLIFNAATMWTGYAIRSYLSPPIFTAKRRIACDSASRSYHVLRIEIGRANV